MIKYTKKSIYILLCLLIFTGFTILAFNPQNSNGSSDIINENDSNIEPSAFLPSPFVVGVKYGPNDIDPPDSYDYNSWNVIDQVCEGLFRYNLSDPELTRINLLAESYWWQDDTTLHLKLREGVTFHDDTSFDSSAAKWNLDRINYLTNATGMIPDYGYTAKSHILWKFTNGTAIMKQIDIVDTYNITIHLNGPYAPFLDLLSISSAAMISPSSHSQTGIIDLTTGDLVGTGPYEYDGYIYDIEVNFHAFENYWQGKANISRIIFSITGDDTARNNAMLIGSIDFLDGPITSLYPTFEADPDIRLFEVPNPGLLYRHLVFNNKKINITWRKAMSYAINYTYIIKDILGNDEFRAYGCISPSYGAAFNHWLRDAPGPADNGSGVYDLTVARQTILDGLSGDPRLDPRLQANDTLDDPLWLNADLATFNYSYNSNSPFRSDLQPVLTDWFDDIGITLLDGGTDWSYFIYRAYGWVTGGYDDLEIFYIAWGPDYLDPFITIDPLFSNTSEFNAAQVNDPWIMGNLSLALKTTDELARNAIYWDLQWRLFAELYVHAPLSFPREVFVYTNELEKYPHNVWGRFYFYPCEWDAPIVIVPPTVIIDSPFSVTGFADTAPTFSLTVSLGYDSIWYSLDNGATTTPCGISGQINPSLWDGLSDAPYTLRFYANDSAGHIGTAAVSIYKDTTDPVIIINDPNPGQEFSTTPPSFDIDITELHLETLPFTTVWYTIEGVASPIFLTWDTTGIIDANAWNSLPDGAINITFYAIDMVGNLGYTSVIVVKNTAWIPGPYPIMILMILLVSIIGLTWRRKHKLK